MVFLLISVLIWLLYSFDIIWVNQTYFLQNSWFTKSLDIGIVKFSYFIFLLWSYRNFGFINNIY